MRATAPTSAASPIFFLEYSSPASRGACQGWESAVMLMRDELSLPTAGSAVMMTRAEQSLPAAGSYTTNQDCVVLLPEMKFDHQDQTQA